MRNTFKQYDLLAQREKGYTISGKRSFLCRKQYLTVVVLVVFLVTCTFFVASSQLVSTSIPFLYRPVSSSPHPLTVLISSADATIGEVDYWIHSILSRLGRPVDVQVVQTEDLRLIDDSVIVAFNDLQTWNDLKDKSSFQNVGLLRIGDEYGNDTDYKRYSYVFRPYWFDHIYESSNADTPVLWIPNGYSTGVGPRLSSTLLPYTERPELCYFEGSARDNGHESSRTRMYNALIKWDAKGRICKVRWTDGFMRGQSPLAYSASLGRAKYALCPAGNSAETIRFYEALENNAIPIVVYEPWMAGVFGANASFPFIVLKTWDELGPRLEALAAEPSRVGHARQMASRQWWEETQNAVRKAAMRLVDESFRRRHHP